MRLGHVRVRRFSRPWWRLAGYAACWCAFVAADVLTIIKTEPLLYQLVTTAYLVWLYNVTGSEADRIKREARRAWPPPDEKSAKSDNEDKPEPGEES